MNLTRDLEEILEGDVLTDEATLASHSGDASIFEMKPEAVVYPKNARDVERLVAFAGKRKKENPSLSLTARAAGTDMTGGPLSESVVVDFSRHFNRVKRVDPQAKTAVAEPGVYYRDFEKETLKHNLIMPAYPASRQICALGGMVSNNSGGELTLRYGKTIDYVSALKVVLADGKEHEIKPLAEAELKKKMRERSFEGEIYKDLFALIKKHGARIEAARPKVSKNSAGYNLWDVWDKDKKVFDLTKLFVGSQGTLGFVTEATFSLVEKNKESQMMVLFLDTTEELGELVQAVLLKNPTTFESYDDKTLRLALKFAPDLVRRLGTGAVFSIIKNSIPEFFSILFHGFPSLVLQITFDGNDATELRARAEELASDLKRFKIRRMEVLRDRREAEEYRLIRRESFNLLRSKVKDKKTAPFIDDFVVNPEHLPQFLPRLDEILSQYKILYTVAGHMGNGNFHIIPLMNLAREEERRLIPELSDKVYDLVLEYGGSITGEHNDGLVRGPFLEKMFGPEVVDIFKEVKRIFDPRGIFNPGKKTGAELGHAMARIAKQ